jgi:hypothetical protein
MKNTKGLVLALMLLALMVPALLLLPVGARAQSCGTTCCDGGPQCSYRYFCQVINTGCQCAFGSPIIIDTIGEGFKLTNAEDGVDFDISGTNQLARMGWTARGSHNAFLALDRNHDGVINSGKELFGNFTNQEPCPKGDLLNDAVTPATPEDQKSCLNGYRALAWFDEPRHGGNGNGIIDPGDEVFSQLRLWIDKNHDGVSQSDELFTLKEMGIDWIDLKYRQVKKTDQWGNWFRFRGNLGSHDDVNRVIYDVFFVMQAPKLPDPNR